MEDLASRISRCGLTVFGKLVPDAHDGVPEGATGRAAVCVILVGNAGSDMFAQFARDCDPQTDLLDDWCEAVLNPIAADAGARAVYPWQKPYLPFLTWARKAGAGMVSPLGMNIHPVYGLWHGMRGALIFEDDVPFVSGEYDLPHPCQNCIDKPCLSACPVDAFVSGKDRPFDSARCVSFLQSDGGISCLQQGCSARLACPIGRNYAYTPEQIRFHLSAFFRACTGT